MHFFELKRRREKYIFIDQIRHHDGITVHSVTVEGTKGGEAGSEPAHGAGSMRRWHRPSWTDRWHPHHTIPTGVLFSEPKPLSCFCETTKQYLSATSIFLRHEILGHRDVYPCKLRMHFLLRTRFS